VTKVWAILLLALTASAHAPASPKLPSLKEFNCLVKNIYYEARGESVAGKIAVGIVTMNRLRHIDYPDTICKVVYQSKQFSWTNTPMKKHKINAEEWQQSINAATAAFNSTKVFPATHYHNLTVRPAWGLRRIAQIGKHIFYV